MSSTAAGLRKGSRRYWLVSSLSITAREYSGSAWAIMASPSSTHIGRSSSGTPMIRARTRIGSSREISSTKSNSPFGRPRSITRRACSRTNPSYWATAPRVKSLVTNRRSREWPGGSMSIIDARASTSSSFCSSSVIPRSEEKLLVSRRMSSMSWYLVMAQNPRLGVGSGCQWTGSRSRSSRKAQSGTSSTKASWLDRSISSSRTLIEASSRATQGSLAPNDPNGQRRRGRSEERQVVVELPRRHLGRRRVADRLGVALPFRPLELGERLDEPGAERRTELVVGLERRERGLEGRWDAPVRVRGLARRLGLGRRHLVLDPEPRRVQGRRRDQVGVRGAVGHPVLDAR